jgi:cell division protein FtsQ
MTLENYIQPKKLFQKNGIVLLFWIALGIGVIVLFSAAMQRQNKQLCSGISVELDKDYQEAFTDESDIADILKKGGNIDHQPLSAIHLKYYESLVKKNAWVKDAALYFDNQNVLHVKVKERIPIALVVTANGNTFYIDSSAMQLPVSDKFAAHVPVFTAYPGNVAAKISKPDSLLLRNMVQMGAYINANMFWNAQMAQINIEPNAEFQIVPAIGNHIINFGTAYSLGKKFNNLLAFFQHIFPHVSMSAYKVIDVLFNNQVVGVKDNSAQFLSDSAKAMNNNEVTWVSDSGYVKQIKKPFGVQNLKEGTSNKTDVVSEKEQISDKQNKTYKPTLSFNQKLGTKNTLHKKNNHVPKSVMKKQ